MWGAQAPPQRCSRPQRCPSGRPGAALPAAAVRCTRSGNRHRQRLAWPPEAAGGPTRRLGRGHAGMDKFLVKKGADGSQPGPKATAGPARKKQLKLSDCKKVVKLQNCSGVGRSLESLQSAQKVLEAALDSDEDDVSDDEVLLALRTLSSLQISKRDLLDNPLGAPVRGLRKHASPEVRQLAENLVEKWKGIVLREERCRAGRTRDFFGGART